MKVITRILMFLSLGMILFNLFQLNWQSPLEGKSLIALIGIIASSCALLLLIILEISKKILVISKSKKN
tara:strand:- start:2625 stop:2831 length:207 start_codon:yes stop_codon:yes gene_type:complete